MHVNARAIIERKTQSGVEIVLQLRNKPHEGNPTLELPGGRVEEFELLLEGGDDTLSVQWLPVDAVVEMMEQNPERCNWIDRAGLLFYLQNTKKGLTS